MYFTKGKEILSWLEPYMEHTQAKSEQSRWSSFLASTAHCCPTFKVCSPCI